MHFSWPFNWTSGWLISEIYLSCIETRIVIYLLQLCRSFIMHFLIVYIFLISILYSFKPINFALYVETLPISTAILFVDLIILIILTIYVGCANFNLS